MNTLFTARQLDRLRRLLPEHKVLTAREGSPIVEAARCTCHGGCRRPRTGSPHAPRRKARAGVAGAWRH